MLQLWITGSFTINFEFFAELSFPVGKYVSQLSGDILSGSSISAEGNLFAANGGELSLAWRELIMEILILFTLCECLGLVLLWGEVEFASKRGR